jgi:hypothetical protein
LSIVNNFNHNITMKVQLGQLLNSVGGMDTSFTPFMSLTALKIDAVKAYQLKLIKKEIATHVEVYNEQRTDKIKELGVDEKGQLLPEHHAEFFQFINGLLPIEVEITNLTEKIKFNDLKITEGSLKETELEALDWLIE